MGVLRRELPDDSNKNATRDELGAGNVRDGAAELGAGQRVGVAFDARQMQLLVRLDHDRSANDRLRAQTTCPSAHARQDGWFETIQ